jgi:serine protease AprX
VLFSAFVTVIALTLPPAVPAVATPGPLVPVIVREAPNAGDHPETLVESLGGTVGTPLELINGFTADVPGRSLDDLAADPMIHSVTPDTKVRLLQLDNSFSTETTDSFVRDGYSDGLYTDDDTKTLESATTDSTETSLSPTTTESSTLSAASAEAPPGWMPLVNDTIGAMDYWAAGYTGAGIDVALIDSGIAPVDGLNLPGKVINGLDVSFESQADNLLHLDTFAHGTHMAGIIAGRDSLADPLQAQAAGEYVGVAPGARILNVKVADANGAVDVSQVIAAIDWVVQHRNDNGMNIRVLNLSFGTDGSQSYRLDPLVYAVKMAWDRGITVVVAAGNDGNGTALRNPALNPYVIAVGATNTAGTELFSDDVVTDFSNCGTSERSVDLVAPGRSIESLRVPESAADQEYPSARVGTRFFKGSGTSQATAVVSGAAALIIEQRPDITPDELKALLGSSARTLLTSTSLCQGAGTLDLGNALQAPTPKARQNFGHLSGNGLLEHSRGSAHLIDNDIVLEGEQDIFGKPFDSSSWAKAAAKASTWSGGFWNDSVWSGASWSGASWSGASWSSASWSSASWSSASWSSASWSSASWSGASWSGASWSGMSWSSASWSSNVWSSKSWGNRFLTMSKSWGFALR